MNNRTEDYVPVIGVAHFWSITALLEKLDKKEVKGVNEVQTSVVENGYAVAIIAIAALVIESAVGRAQYLQSILPPMRPLDYVAKHVPEFYDDLEEVFVIRDVIAHNHLWDARITYDADGGMKLVSATLRQGYGDRKFRSAVDPSTRKTRRLKLNAFPTRIWYGDVVIVLNKMVDFLEALDRVEKRVFNFGMQPVLFQEKPWMFADLVRRLDR